MEHEIVEIMASSWDEAGHRPPTNWRVICTCGHAQRGLKDRASAVVAQCKHNTKLEE